MSKPLLAFYLFIWSMTIANSFAQKNEYINGQLLDTKTDEPIVFASIRIKGRALGVISNADGGFRIPLKYKIYGDTLEISSMGYERKELMIDQLSEFERHVIKLNPVTFNLTEAVVLAKKIRKLSARQIVRKAIRAIPDNYPIEPFSSVGYYRDYQLDSLLQYVNLNEAILEVFDEGFQTIDSTSTKVKIYDYIENNNFMRDSLALKSYDYESKERRKVIHNAFLQAHGGNEFAILRVHDALRNYKINSYSFVHRLKSDLLSEHKFNRVADTYFDEEPLYTIKFKKLQLNYSAYGTLYISRDNFAFHKIEYAVYDRRNAIADGKLNKNGNENNLIFEITTEYGEKDNKMFLKYISFQNTFKLYDPPKLVTEFIEPDYKSKCFVIGFNNKVRHEAAESLANYEIKVKGKVIKMRKPELFDSQIVTLCPNMNPVKAEAMLWEIYEAARKNKITNDLFEIKLSNISDFDGNIINQWTSRNYNQFREFFVQEVKPNTIVPQDTLFMNKHKPIFEDQPIVKPDNFDDYWMNTPLRTIKN